MHLHEKPHTIHGFQSIMTLQTKTIKLWKNVTIFTLCSATYSMEYIGQCGIIIVLQRVLKRYVWWATYWNDIYVVVA